MRWITRLLPPLLLALAAGCVSSPRATADALRRATEAAVAGIDPHIVLLKLERPAKDAGAGGRSSGMPGSEAPTTLVGVVVTPAGHVLTPALVEATPDLRIRAFMGDREFRARIRGKDESMGLTLLQLDGEGPFSPLPTGPGVTPRPGEWLAARLPNEEPFDFERHTLLLNVRGETPGHVRRYGVSGLYREARGTPVVNMDGRLVGLAGLGDVLLWDDIRADVAELVARCQPGAVTPKEREEDGKAWLGVSLQAVNKDLARARGWPVGCLRAAHVEPGAAAWRAGLRKGDIVTGLNGKPLRFSGGKTREYFMQALRPRVGRPFTLAVLRGDDDMELAGAMEKRPEPETLVVEELGVTVQAITAMDEAELDLASREGVRVTELQKGGAASNSGSMGRTLLSRNDVIVSLGGKPTPDLNAFREAAAALRRDKPEAVVVRYLRGRLSGFAGLNLKSAQKNEGDKS
jgi:serine protease Do